MVCGHIKASSKKSMLKSEVEDSSFDPHFLSTALDGAAFASRMPANKMTQQEIEFFPDVAHGSQSAMLEFLYIRNRLLQMWINNPGSELTAEKAQNTVVLPQSGKGRGL